MKMIGNNDILMSDMIVSLSHSVSDEDDTAELLKELQKIKKERAEEQAKKVQAKIRNKSFIL